MDDEDFPDALIVLTAPKDDDSGSPDDERRVNDGFHVSHLNQERSATWTTEGH